MNEQFINVKTWRAFFNHMFVFADGGVFVANQSIARQAHMQIDLNYLPMAIFDLLKPNPRIQWFREDGVRYVYGVAHHDDRYGNYIVHLINWSTVSGATYLGSQRVGTAWWRWRATQLIRKAIKQNDRRNRTCSSSRGRL